MRKYPVSQREFKKQVKTHVMSVLQDDGIYRHIRFERPETRAYYFEIITIPGTLIITGDCGTWAFSRVADMFTFFRSETPKGGSLSINPRYWSEKLIAVDGRGGPNRNGPCVFSHDVFERRVREYYKEWVRWNETTPKQRRELWQAIQDSVLYAEDERDAHESAGRFQHEGFQFSDFWECDLTEYDHGFIWNLYAIVWAIGQYDKSKKVKK